MKSPPPEQIVKKLRQARVELEEGKELSQNGV